jgi:hypothetical protein
LSILKLIKLLYFEIFTDEFSNHLNEPKLPPLLGLNPLKSFNCNDALIKKAAANIDIKAMGDKGILSI